MEALLIIAFILACIGGVITMVELMASIDRDEFMEYGLVRVIVGFWWRFFFGSAPWRSK